LSDFPSAVSFVCHFFCHSWSLSAYEQGAHLSVVSRTLLLFRARWLSVYSSPLSAASLMPLLCSPRPTALICFWFLHPHSSALVIVVAPFVSFHSSSVALLTRPYSRSFVPFPFPFPFPIFFPFSSVCVSLCQCPLSRLYSEAHDTNCPSFAFLSRSLFQTSFRVLTPFVAQGTAWHAREGRNRKMQHSSPGSRCMARLR